MSEINTTLLQRITAILVLCGLIVSCSPKTTVSDKSKESEQKVDSKSKSVVPGPQVIIYKTKENYFDKIPVTLSVDKSSILAYPDKIDIDSQSGFPYPTRLVNGFLLDNKGINENTAFLDITYEEYSQLDQTPSAKELFDAILSSNPILEMYECGLQHEYTCLKEDLNDLIEANKLDAFNKVK